MVRVAECRYCLGNNIKHRSCEGAMTSIKQGVRADRSLTGRDESDRRLRIDMPLQRAGLS